MNYFIGIPISNPDVLDVLKNTWRHKMPDADWTDSQNYHFTLKHIGPKMTRYYQKMWQELKEASIQSFEYSLSGLDVLSGRVLYAKPSGDAETYLKTIAFKYLKCETLKPHCTIAKYGFRSGKTIPMVFDKVNVFSPQQAERICLYRTQGGGKPYLVEDEVLLT